MKKLRAGVIGLGVGEQHVYGYQAHPGCEVVALCDFDEIKIAEAAEKFPGVKVVRDANEVLDDPDIDVVSIATFDNFHAEQTLRALANGKHVFVEKPFCMNEEEARAVRIALNENAALKLSSNLVLRLSPRFSRVKKLIDTGVMGKVYYVEGDYNYGRLYKITEGWRGKLDFYSVVFGGGVHMIDLLMWFAGERISEVSAFGSDLIGRGTDFKYNDTVASILKFENGALGKMTANFGCMFPHFHPIQVYGEKATFVNGFEHGLLYTSREPEDSPEKMYEAYKWSRKGDLILSFADSIINNGKPAVTADEVFDVMSVCFAIEKSAAENRSVKVEYI